MSEEQLVVLRWLFRVFWDVRVGERSQHIRLGSRDDLSNWLMWLVGVEGCQFWASVDPEADGYHLAIVDGNEQVVLRDVDLGLDFTGDADIAEEYWDKERADGE